METIIYAAGYLSFHFFCGYYAVGKIYGYFSTAYPGCDTMHKIIALMLWVFGPIGLVSTIWFLWDKKGYPRKYWWK